MSHSVSATEKSILEAFDIDEEFVEREIQEIQEKLKKGNVEPEE